jgi:hypothetical protein
LVKTSSQFVLQLMRLVSLKSHWQTGVGIPVTHTAKWTVAVASAVWLAGDLEIVGGTPRMLRRAGALVTAPKTFVMTTV